ncbi:ABC transporter permease [Hominibacterium faecale]|uniref:ABC transporter permease n=1 Tax=Hominibacterium faecale TaxID=2839743 RepID=UPI0022B2A36F|nr:ABC transporter permease [Hominibacterium faecale]
MIGRILKKDMKRRKSINLILFLFITIATIFLSSSVGNILVASSAQNFYLDYAKIPQINIITSGTEEKADIERWLKKDAPGVKTYGYDHILILPEKGVDLSQNNKKKAFDANGASIYLSAKTEPYCKVFDKDGKDFDLGEGDIALTQVTMDRNDLQTGDQVTIKVGDMEKTFTIKLAIKDAAFGSDMAGMCRLVVSSAEYARFAANDKADLLGMHYVDTDDEERFNQELNNHGFTTLSSTIDKNTYKMAYSFDMLTVALLILIGICLILIALLVLRFTLVFTIEEDYREIGIMKAVGIKSFAIKKVYLAKYLILVTAGALCGLAVSIPVSRVMLSSVSKNLILENSDSKFWVNSLCALLIILLVMGFSYGCMHKLNKVSAITAIHGGQTGERYGKRAGFRLYRRKRMPVTAFLGVNDIFSHVKRYLVLMITFCISFILITIPLNTINTMQSDEMARQFCVNPDTAVCAREIEGSGKGTYKTSVELEKDMDRVTDELKAKGYEAELTGVAIYFFQYKEPRRDDNTNVMTTQILGSDQNFLRYQEGDAPVLENEIAFSQQILEENGWKIGDSVETQIGGKEKRMIITGTYSDYMQLGKSARLNPKVDCSKASLFDYWNIMVKMDTNLTQKQLAEKLEKELPDYEWATAQDVVDRNTGGIQQSLEDMIVPMTAVLLSVIMLITFLMERLFVVREKGEIAMMKSMGFQNKDIRMWQTLRMVLVALLSMLAAVPLSLLSNQFVLKPIFSAMGANVEIQVVPLQVYGICPAVLLLGIIIATMLASINVKKINIRELNNLE